MGLLRSSLLKSKPGDGAPAAPVVERVRDPFAIDPLAANPFAIATTVPAMSPFQAAPEEPAPNTLRDGIEIVVEAPAPSEPRAPFLSAPSTSDLLERAAALGPARMTWESIVLPSDPILDEKRTPHVAERRARLTRIVKGTLGACVAVCVLALGVTALSAMSGDAPSAASSALAGNAARTIPSKAVVPVETLSITPHGKAAHVFARASRPAPPVPAPRGKRR